MIKNNDIDFSWPDTSRKPQIIGQSNDNIVSATMDFAQLEELKLALNDSRYIEYIFHKLFDNPTAEYNPAWHTVWNYPECWLARYYLYYVVNQHYLADAKILELGSNLNFYSVWTMLNGAKKIDCIEPDSTRKALGDEYVGLRNLSHAITTKKMSIDDYMQSYNGESYDIVFFMDVVYYLLNGIEVLEFIKNKIKPKILFFERLVVIESK